MIIPWLVLTGATTAAAAAGYRWHARRASAREKVYHFVRCTCGQKLRYQAARAGRASLCPSCGTKLTLPREPHTLGSAPAADSALDGGSSTTRRPVRLVARRSARGRSMSAEARV